MVIYVEGLHFIIILHTTQYRMWHDIILHDIIWSDFSHTGAFSDLVSLTTLNLENGNDLTTIHEAIFDVNNHPSNIETFYLSSNPLICDYQLCWLYKADGNWLTVKNPTLICDGPPALAGRTWGSLLIAELNCPGLYSVTKVFYTGVLDPITWSVELGRGQSFITW